MSVGRINLLNLCKRKVKNEVKEFTMGVLLILPGSQFLES